MLDTKVCEWLMNNADAPIRYRVARELLKDKKTAQKIENELLENPAVKLWLKNLKPETPPQHRGMIHGSFDFCLENAMLKALQLGLHTGLPQVSDAVKYYMDIFKNNPAAKPYRKVNFQMDLLLIANIFTLADFQDKLILEYMLESLDEIYHFVKKGDYDIYLDDKETAGLKGTPKVWKDKKFIKKSLFDNGPVYPLIYDIIGLHKLYGAIDSKVDEKLDSIISYISTDEFHNKISDKYGIVICDGNKYYSMGWDPKYPGWFDVAGYLENNRAPKLLFFAQYIKKYPIAVKTKWFNDLLIYIEKYKTENGTYLFPAEWLQEKTGYAVEGSHISFGENRKKKNWREIEATFYVQLLHQ